MKTRYQSQTSEEAWYTVVKDLEYRIINEEYKAGQRLPSIRALTDEYRVSQWTIQKALEKMANEEIIVMKRGTGYFIKPFVQRKLLNKHKEHLQKIIMEAILYGEKIGISADELLMPYYKHTSS